VIGRSKTCVNAAPFHEVKGLPSFSSDGLPDLTAEYRASLRGNLRILYLIQELLDLLIERVDGSVVVHDIGSMHAFLVDR
jgi:hypothetical protein